MKIKKETFFKAVPFAVGITCAAVFGIWFKMITVSGHSMDNTLHDGQTIDIDFENHTVTVNGVILEEPYIKEPTSFDGGAFQYPVTVPDDCFFVMGDNRNDSRDSRFPDVGFVNKKDIIGKIIRRE